MVRTLESVGYVVTPPEVMPELTPSQIRERFNLSPFIASRLLNGFDGLICKRGTAPTKGRRNRIISVTLTPTLAAYLLEKSGKESI